MSLLTIPYSFAPNELAESSQVNANFSACATAVNSLASEVFSGSYNVTGGSSIIISQLISGQLFVAGPTITSFVNATNSAYTAVDASAFNIGSDAKWKRDIVDSAFGLAAVLRLRPRSFVWIDSNQNDVGFVAQEVRDVIPEMVHDNGLGLTLNYSGIVSALVKAIQEQQTQIDELRNYLLSQGQVVVSQGAL